MRISDWSSDVCSSDLRAALHFRYLELPGDGSCDKVLAFSGDCLDGFSACVADNRRFQTVRSGDRHRDMARLKEGDLILASDTVRIGLGREGARKSDNHEI